MASKGALASSAFCNILHTGKSLRARKNRLSELLQEKPPLGHILLETVNPYTHAEEKRTFYLKTLVDILLPPTHRGAGHRQNSLPAVKVNIVEASDGESKWVLLTNLPVLTLEDAVFVVQSYKKRWHIESLHKVLKTTYKADQIYLHSSKEAILNLLTIINIAACQTYRLIHYARQGQNIPASLCFSSLEIDSLSVYLFQKKPEQGRTISLQTFYYMIAGLGGYKNNKHPPGILTIYRGIKKLSHITKMYSIMCHLQN